ncbi:tryptophan-rich sensory protein [Ramlibacter sp.]|uniref:tryptophan-rich sensory protein n=1 Tax=Ramlibacter sp. TaxID=1917967 RepID=UPI0025CEB736|nr:tryptophan-rich sensory protein [Ramlibacter sp.]
MLVLLALIVLTVRAFWRARRLAAVLMLPYLAWVAFASALTGRCGRPIRCC